MNRNGNSILSEKYQYWECVASVNEYIFWKQTTLFEDEPHFLGKNEPLHWKWYSSEKIYVMDFFKDCLNFADNSIYF